MKTRLGLPQGHGEVVTQPDYGTWASIIEENTSAAANWDFEICGQHVQEFRASAREEALQAARVFSARMGVLVREVADSDRIVMTGHQPTLYHPGVWAKDFLLQRLSDETGALGLDLVVDTDSYDMVALHAPCRQPEVSVCTLPLALADAGVCYQATPTPSAEMIQAFRQEGARALATLDAIAPSRHFAEFCDALERVAEESANLAELVTFARRSFEAETGSDYLELPVSVMAGTPAFLRFAADTIRRGREFASAYNTELADYRTAHRTRSPLQPFPDLRVAEESVELPFWYIDGDSRDALVAVPGSDAVEIVLGDRLLATVPNDVEGALEVLGALPGIIAPKALVLTLYARMFLSDLFIHGIGGGRYDRVTDGVIERYFGVRPHRFSVASMTMYLPLGMPLVTDEELRAAEAKLHRFEHNPDEALESIEWDDDAERAQALELANEKAELVRAIALPDADKKTLGLRIREVNERLRGVLEPLARELRAEIESLRVQYEASMILTDRTYPFCLWSPQEVRDKVL